MPIGIMSPKTDDANWHHFENIIFMTEILSTEYRDNIKLILVPIIFYTHLFQLSKGNYGVIVHRNEFGSECWLSFGSGLHQLLRPFVAG